MAALKHARTLADSLSLTPSEAGRHGLDLNRDGRRRTAFELLSRSEVDLDQLVRIWPALGVIPPDIARQLEIDAKYHVYLSRQAADIAAYRRDENLELPADLDYGALRGLSAEVAQKLGALRPRSIGQAARIDGVTPAALTLLLAHLHRRRAAAARMQAG
jgi:tRNA uridine 5-carboxymethylaminomethyl modification enzyme